MSHLASPTTQIAASMGARAVLLSAQPFAIIDGSCRRFVGLLDWTKNSKIALDAETLDQLLARYTELFATLQGEAQVRVVGALSYLTLHLHPTQVRLLHHINDARWLQLLVLSMTISRRL